MRPAARRARAPRPLDPLRSLKLKLGVLVGATSTAAALVVWAGMHHGVATRFTLPAAVLLALVVTQLLARGMTSPLREMTAAARAMARGDYSRRVRTSSRDEVGQLAVAFNRMAEDLGSADAQRRELVANVSHELRTPVTALRAQLENVVDGVTAPEPSVLADALAQTERLGQLVARLLDLTRLEAGVAQLQAEPTPVRPLLQEAVHAAALVGRQTDKDLRWELDVVPADLAADVDPARLRQVVTNLLDNASRHSPAGGAVAVAARRGTGRDAGSWVLEVSDEGRGIAPRDREHVFERFHRGTPDGDPDASPDGGTGLGLAIARWAVDLHGGRIEVVDAVAGARLRVTLPLRAPLQVRTGGTSPVAAAP